MFHFCKFSSVIFLKGEDVMIAIVSFDYVVDFRNTL